MNIFGTNSVIDIVVMLWPLWLLLGATLIIRIIFEIWLPNTIKKWKNKRRFQKGEAWRSDQQLVQWLRKMSPKDFEVYIADLFDRLHYKTQVVGGSHDGGIDVIAEKDGVVNYIQCKKFITQQVTVGAMRDFYGALANKLSTGRGYFITTNVFTLEAEQFAEDKPIELIDGAELVRHIRLVQKDEANSNSTASENNKCPKCGGNIHPFGNGNGRVVRLLTYAMLCKKGFITASSARLFNPTAVFSGDRQKYYNKLSIADRGSDKDILEWPEYVLSGLKEEIDKSQKLTNAEFVQNEILVPMIAWAQEKNITSDLETKVLIRLTRKNTIKASDIRDLWPTNRSHVIVSKFLRRMKEQNFIEPLSLNGREYIIKFTENKLTRGILDQMEKQGMLPIKVDEVAGTQK